MRRITFDRLIKEFREEYLKEVGYNENTIADIVTSLFKGIKDNMSNPTLPEIRITHMGTFSVLPGRVAYSLKKTIINYKTGKINAKEFEEMIGILLDYVDRNIEKFTKFANVIKETKEYVRDYYNGKW